MEWNWDLRVISPGISWGKGTERCAVWTPSGLSRAVSRDVERLTCRSVLSGQLLTLGSSPLVISDRNLPRLN